MGQPSWARPALLLIAAVSAVVYGWDLTTRLYGSADVYLATVRSMSESWSGFLFGAFDPAASITLDKIPGGLWPAALSASIFGFDTWSALLPQVIAAVLTVLVLYRVARRLAGPAAGLLAAGAMAAMPVAAALAHVTWPDTFLTLLLALAADAALRAISTGSLRSLVLAGVWVGLATHAKMLVAWGTLPALAVAYLVAAPPKPLRRLAHVGIAGAVTIAVSSVWLVIVSLTPASSRPYIDGTTDNDPFSMVFGYNGFSIFSAGQGSRTDTPFETGLLPTLFGSMAPQAMWLFPVALIGLVFGLASRARAARTDLLRAGLLLWGLWLVTFGAVFSTAVVNHVAYSIVLGPGLAALFGVGLVLLWRAYREGGWQAWLLPAAIAATAVWSIVVSGRFDNFLTWLAPATAVFGGLAVVLLALARVLPRVPKPAVPAGVATGLVAMLLAPAAWTVATTDKAAYSGIMANPAAGPMGAELQYADLPADQKQSMLAALEKQAEMIVASMEQSGGRMLSPEGQALLRHARSGTDGQKYLFATPDSGLASAFIIEHGASILPIGGFVGDIPFPAERDFVRHVESGDLRYVVDRAQPPNAPAPGGTAGTTTAQRNLAWVKQHCTLVDPEEYFQLPGAQPGGGGAGAQAQPGPRTRWMLYDCAGRQG
ncbi:glycosyltransferase family 39 protein [Amycolatopsis cihanbeyliensis]|uniref:glycosyltransferase family 39 protein n=1 Tax=Amycolatopsis cihanbeyliensis TaxID=1128664 RepID=UPI001FE95BBE|nr:glycosyltransferase family 39 protein [Amycolatopsis cihanbeyliensis]